MPNISIQISQLINAVSKYGCGDRIRTIGLAMCCYPRVKLIYPNNLKHSLRRT